jgi:hypothetical protein
MEPLAVAARPSARVAASAPVSSYSRSSSSSSSSSSKLTRRRDAEQLAWQSRVSAAAGDFRRRGRRSSGREATTPGSASGIGAEESEDERVLRDLMGSESPPPSLRARRQEENAVTAATPASSSVSSPRRSPLPRLTSADSHRRPSAGESGRRPSPAVATALPTFDELDTDGDGVISRQEWEAAAAKGRRSPRARARPATSPSSYRSAAAVAVAAAGASDEHVLAKLLAYEPPSRRSGATATSPHTATLSPTPTPTGVGAGAGVAVDVRGRARRERAREGAEVADGASTAAAGGGAAAAAAAGAGTSWRLSAMAEAAKKRAARQSPGKEAGVLVRQTAPSSSSFTADTAASTQHAAAAAVSATSGGHPSPAASHHQAVPAARVTTPRQPSAAARVRYSRSPKEVLRRLDHQAAAAAAPAAGSEADSSSGTHGGGGGGGGPRGWHRRGLSPPSPRSQRSAASALLGGGGVINSGGGGGRARGAAAAARALPAPSPPTRSRLPSSSSSAAAAASTPPPPLLSPPRRPSTARRAEPIGSDRRQPAAAATDPPYGIHAAVTKGHVGILNMLLDLGHSPDVRSAVSGLTPLHTACAAGQAAMATALLRRGADATALTGTAKDRTSGGYTPRQLALAAGHTACVRALDDDDAATNSRSGARSTHRSPGSGPSPGAAHSVRSAADGDPVAMFARASSRQDEGNKNAGRGTLQSGYPRTASSGRHSSESAAVADNANPAHSKREETGLPGKKQSPLDASPDRPNARTLHFDRAKTVAAVQSDPAAQRAASLFAEFGMEPPEALTRHSKHAVAKDRSSLAAGNALDTQKPRQPQAKPQSTKRAWSDNLAKIEQDLPRPARTTASEDLAQQLRDSMASAYNTDLPAATSASPPKAERRKQPAYRDDAQSSRPRSSPRLEPASPLPPTISRATDSAMMGTAQELAELSAVIAPAYGKESFVPQHLSDAVAVMATSPERKRTQQLVQTVRTHARTGPAASRVGTGQAPLPSLDGVLTSLDRMVQDVNPVPQNEPAYGAPTASIFRRLSQASQPQSNPEPQDQRLSSWNHNYKNAEADIASSSRTVVVERAHAREQSATMALQFSASATAHAQSRIEAQEARVASKADTLRVHLAADHATTPGIRTRAGDAQPRTTNGSRTPGHVQLVATLQIDSARAREADGLIRLSREGGGQTDPIGQGNTDLPTRTRSPGSSLSQNTTSRVTAEPAYRDDAQSSRPRSSPRLEPASPLPPTVTRATDSAMMGTAQELAELGAVIAPAYGKESFVPQHLSDAVAAMATSPERKRTQQLVQTVRTHARTGPAASRVGTGQAPLPSLDGVLTSLEKEPQPQPQPPLELQPDLQSELESQPQLGPQPEPEPQLEPPQPPEMARKTLLQPAPASAASPASPASPAMAKLGPSTRGQVPPAMTTSQCVPQQLASQEELEVLEIAPHSLSPTRLGQLYNAVQEVVEAWEVGQLGGRAITAALRGMTPGAAGLSPDLLGPMLALVSVQLERLESTVDSIQRSVRDGPAAANANASASSSSSLQQVTRQTELLTMALFAHRLRVSQLQGKLHTDMTLQLELEARLRTVERGNARVLKLLARVDMTSPRGQAPLAAQSSGSGVASAAQMEPRAEGEMFRQLRRFLDDVGLLDSWMPSNQGDSIEGCLSVLAALQPQLQAAADGARSGAAEAGLVGGLLRQQYDLLKALPRIEVCACSARYLLL